MMKQMRADDKDERKCSVNETEKVEKRCELLIVISIVSYGKSGISTKQHYHLSVHTHLVFTVLSYTTFSPFCCQDQVRRDL